MKMLHFANVAQIVVNVPTKLVLPMLHNVPVSLNKPFLEEGIMPLA